MYHNKKLIELEYDVALATPVAFDKTPFGIREPTKAEQLYMDSISISISTCKINNIFHFVLPYNYSSYKIDVAEGSKYWIFDNDKNLFCTVFSRKIPNHPNDRSISKFWSNPDLIKKFENTNITTLEIQSSKNQDINCVIL